MTEESLILEIDGFINPVTIPIAFDLSFDSVLCIAWVGMMIRVDPTGLEIVNAPPN
jgi:hypothetical protein